MRVRAWLDRNEGQHEAHIRQGFSTAGARRHLGGRAQNGVDVQLAVDALSGALGRTYDAAVLVTGDGDFVPRVEAIRENGPLAADQSGSRAAAAWPTTCRS